MNAAEQLNEIHRVLNRHYSVQEYPALSFQEKTWAEAGFLAGKRVFDATPVFRNSLAKYAPLLAAGADLTIGYSDVFPYDPAVIEFLNGLGIRTVKNDYAETDPFDFVLDCAGLFRAKQPSVGFVELTRSGVEKYRNAEKPVYIADSSRTKEIETCLGTGDGCLRALRSLGCQDLAGKTILQFGYGKVGRGIAYYLTRAGAEVAVVDRWSDGRRAISPIRKIELGDTPEILNILPDAWGVVSATGVAGALAPFQRAFASSRALLINMGAEDEYGPEMKPERVLNGKKPLNFMLDEPTHIKYIDATLTLHNEGIRILLERSLPPGPCLPDAETEDAILRRVVSDGLIGAEIQTIGL